MNTNQSSRQTIAIPYYGYLRIPGQGYSRIFFQLEFHDQQATRQLVIWCPTQEIDLPTWLARQGIVLVLCADQEIHNRKNFETRGVTVIPGQDGDPDKLAELALAWAAKHPDLCPGETDPAWKIAI